MNIYKNVSKCYLHKINEDSVLLITELIENQSIVFHLIETTINENFNVSLIENFNDLSHFDNIYSCISSLSNYLILSNGIKVFIINLFEKKLKLSTEIMESKSTNKIEKLYSITNTDDFFCLTNNSHLLYIQYDEKINQTTVFAKSDLKVSKIEIMKNILVISDLDNQLIIFNLDDIRANKMLPKEPLLKIMVNNLEYFSISKDANYIAILEKPKSLSLYRVKDASKCAQVELYSRINGLIIDEKFVILAMKDRRILSYLIVDPLVVEHRLRIKELPSRYLNRL